MSGSRIATIVRKDFGEFARNRFFVFITLLVLIAWVAVFWFLPDSVDETVRVGISQSDLGGVLPAADEAEVAGLALISYPSEADLRTAVEDGDNDIVAGIAFPSEFLTTLAAGDTPTVTLFVPAGLPAQQERMIEGLIGEAAFGVAGVPPPVNPVTEAVVLGTDRVGQQISLQEQMRPLLLIMVLMVETFALSSLVAIEIQERTVVAVLATPTRVVDFLAAKGVFGVGLSFIEVALLGLLIGAFAVNAPAIMVVLLMGAILVTGLGMIAGSYGRDFLGTLMVSMLFMIPLMIPAFGALFPGTSPAWIRILPTYGLVEAVVRVTVDGESWSEIAPALLMLAAWGVALFTAGAYILRRRVAAL